MMLQLYDLAAIFSDDDFSDDLIGIVAFVIFCLLAIGVGFLAYRRWRLRFAASGWTMTEATIQGDFPSRQKSSGFVVLFNVLTRGSLTALQAGGWDSVLQYSYQVAGEFYSGYFMLRRVFSSEDDARSAAQPWLEKKRIFVRYNPSKPQESAFCREDGAPKGSRSLGDQPPASDETITLSLR